MDNLFDGLGRQTFLFESDSLEVLETEFPGVFFENRISQFANLFPLLLARQGRDYLDEFLWIIDIEGSTFKYLSRDLVIVWTQDLPTTG